MPAPSTLSNWSMYRLLELSSVNCLFVIDAIKYLYPQLNSSCPDDCKIDKLQDFHKQFSTIHSIHSCKNFENIKEHDFNWFINLYSKVNSSETCSSPSKGDIFQLCQKTNEDFSKLLKQLMEQYSCLSLEQNFDITKQLALLKLFHQNMLELQSKTEFNIDKEMKSPFTWSDIEPLNQDCSESNSKTLHPVSTTKGIILILQDNDTQKCLDAQQLLNNASPSSSYNQTATQNAPVDTLNKHSESGNVIFQKISVNKSKKTIQREIDRFVSEVCRKNKSLLLEINEN
ncbi:uncharacterized protein LOC106871904 [Octopus bimaculoides]|uniref:Uncharacterized protein n=1 Tax=Octopus bimaculoides TaxID=37653 RepID=A0A0L8HAB0_OCTBM|nr:uncharacterized protein LOC106871904 [Octopus bimaculoides]|eukprot:XP_014774145.1 PREDICTED: uncharacterized protein LOC106871904 [Octopus bimaculoides]